MPPVRIELTTTPLPRVCSTTEPRRHQVLILIDFIEIDFVDWSDGIVELGKMGVKSGDTVKIGNFEFIFK